MVGLYMFFHCINLDYPNLTCQLRPWYDIIHKFITGAVGCDRVGYCRHGIVRCVTKTKIARFCR